MSRKQYKVLVYHTPGGLVSSPRLRSFNGNPNRTVFLIVYFEWKTELKSYLRTFAFTLNACNIHTEISAC